MYARPLWTFSVICATAFGIRTLAGGPAAAATDGTSHRARATRAGVAIGPAEDRAAALAARAVGTEPADHELAARTLAAQLELLENADVQSQLARFAALPLGLAASAPSGPGGVVQVDFDSVVAPTTFLETTPLLGPFEGAFFSARFPNGGAVLDEDSNFGVTGYSSPNFLAFNASTSYVNGGVPAPPELVRLGSGLTHIELRVGASTPGLPFAIVGFGPAGSGPVSMAVTQNAMLLVTLDGTHLSGFVIVGTPQDLVVDDILAF